MHDLVGVVHPLKRSGDTPFQGMSPINVGDLRQVSQAKIIPDNFNCSLHVDTLYMWLIERDGN